MQDAQGQLDLGGRPHGTYRARDDPAHDVRATAHAGQARHWAPRDHADPRASPERPPPTAPPVKPGPARALGQAGVNGHDAINGEAGQNGTAGQNI